MAQNDNQNGNPKDQGDGFKDQSTDESTRATRSESAPAEPEQNQGTQRPDQGADLDEADDLDEDRDEDSRGEGGTNRRNNIG